MNWIFRWLAFCGGCAALCLTAPAQTLSEKLRQEGPASLAQAARQEGSAVRGAILFPQKKLNCVACHSPGAKDLLGPDLTRLDPDVTDEHLVESILEPSKVINKDFAAVQVLTVAGRVVVGRILEQNDVAITLRVPSDTESLVRLPKANIELVKPQAKSTMPDDLVDQLESRQQFLDLVRYVRDIAATGGAVSIPSHGGGQVEQRVAGLALLRQFRCARCHAEPANAITAAPAPDLHSVAGRADPGYLRRFIADPQQVKPGTHMPDVMGKLDRNARQQAATAITDYLISLSEVKWQQQRPEQEAIVSGEKLFHSVGCVACHAPRDGRAVEEKTADDAVPLGDLGQKYSLPGLTAFLENPHAARPAGLMPNMMLTHWEAIEIASYLLQGSELRQDATANKIQDQPATPASSPSQVSLGKQYFQQLGCADCHDPAATEGGFTAPPMAQVNPARGCLSQNQGQWPRFHLKEAQRQAMAEAIERSSEPLSDSQRIVLTMETFRCFACHQRDDLGGVSDERNVHFQTTNQNLGPQGRIPPTLTGVGAKLKPKWMREVLVSGRTIRPYMKTRMPQYGAPQVAPLVELFQRVDARSPVRFATLKDEKEARKIGTDLVGSGGLNCIACHTFQRQPSQTMPAVDLTEMAQRLHKDWFYRYMRQPQLLSPNTVMPSFWPGGKAIRRDILGGDA
ncbi:MAG: c-type cytochrome, partial [Pirellulales bacterium]|nr:c-type cytochrome [Pirellulales bacterium]